MLKHENISIFVPNNGCPHMCSFCNQFQITGKKRQPGIKDIDDAIKNSYKNKYKNEDNSQDKHENKHENGNKNIIKPQKIFRELAFFGGSFTAIKRDYAESLLSHAYCYIKSGDIDGIRISTRPDCINEEILKFLKSYGVTSIELGAQSMVDKVLFYNNRGHTSGDVRHSSGLIKNYGFELGLQMMTGLYGSEEKDDLFTANEFIKLQPDTVRIYPTLIMKGTKLHELFNLGKYIPIDINKAVEICAKILNLFNFAGIKVIRLGLHSSDGISKNLIAGPWHPAFKELCESKIIVDKCIKSIKELGYEKKPIKILVSPKSVSKIIGQKRSGIERIKKLCSEVLIEEDYKIKDLNFLIKEHKQT